MRISTIARIGAVAFVAIVITCTALDLNMPAARPVSGASAASTEAQSAPLRSELQRCQSIGMAAADDGGCLRAWAENRRRFLAPGARPQAPIETAWPASPNAMAANDSAITGEPR